MGIFKTLSRPRRGGSNGDSRHGNSASSVRVGGVEEEPTSVIIDPHRSHEEPLAMKARILKSMLAKRLSTSSSVKHHHKSPSTPRKRSKSPEVAASPPTQASSLPPSISDESGLVVVRLRGLPTRCKGCSICFELFEIDETVTYMPCGHFCHSKCLQPWLKRHGSCPTCRQPVTPSTDRSSNHEDCDASDNDNSSPQQQQQASKSLRQRIQSVTLPLPPRGGDAALSSSRQSKPRAGKRHQTNAGSITNGSSGHGASGSRRRPARSKKPQTQRQKSRSCHTDMMAVRSKLQGLERPRASHPRRKITSVIIPRTLPTNDEDECNDGSDDEQSVISSISFHG